MVDTSSEEREYLCPVDIPLRHLGGKWKLIICFYLLRRPLRNGELRRVIPQVRQKMLTQQLRELEASGIVHREVHAQQPPKVVYSIVPAERAALEPVVTALCDWGWDHVGRHGGRIVTTELPPEVFGVTPQRDDVA
jgi:DNA-binding HxlR family transcriptional regulator